MLAGGCRERCPTRKFESRSASMFRCPTGVGGFDPAALITDRAPLVEDGRLPVPPSLPPN